MRFIVFIVFFSERKDLWFRYTNFKKKIARSRHRAKLSFIKRLISPFLEVKDGLNHVFSPEFDDRAFQLLSNTNLASQTGGREVFR
jgi:hypothetical protein